VTVSAVELRRAARKAREWTEERDRLVVAAYRAGDRSLREIGELVGLSPEAVRKMVRRARVAGRVAEPPAT
jgi:DNA-directed RNA polymerase specialized sigma24 family protein